MAATIPSWANLRERVAAVMRRDGVSPGEVSRRTGIHRSTVTTALLHAGDTQWGTAIRILAALGLGMRWVMSAAPPAKPAQKKGKP